MSGSRKMQVAVSVATVWTSPESPRPLDEPATAHPANIEGWLASLTLEDKLDLSDANRVQTQLLYGSEVIVTEEKGEWASIRIPDQLTSKNMLGYPGWLPKRQLAETIQAGADAVWAEVVAPRTELQFRSGIAPIRISYLTRLPVEEQTGEQVVVRTPQGIGVLAAKDVRIAGGAGSEPAAADHLHPGFRIVDQAMTFLGLPYLWGGLSAFGYDCSGFAYSMYKSQGIQISRDASDQAREGREIGNDSLEPGDLLFFAHDQGKGKVHHVGIYAGGNRMLHSPDSKGAVELVELSGFRLAEELCSSRRYWG
ncbi:Gamma-D-glutamyl-L-lysine dipeptidyl-peptidase [Paenibacillus solanacearum]|uniref:Gamma-D-glutamyl-L-lysine dipeptidyl-peptidase n=1 Tax=Paenibacillus solanacearum TaxID=2048548 RepID=A0A916JZY9_9BACL|nr:NlpC/P60 family protein [Paenibacillus solanacearum]CAG7618766.1 Gamma-D-glutamyl-L-lysine dipeptidyl-peptidase [Paenibacillus solanacearum]